MKILKDLLYTGGNQALDISRLASLLAVLTLLGCSIWQVVAKGIFSPTEFGTGVATTFAGCAAWIFARQTKESST